MRKLQKPVICYIHLSPTMLFSYSIGLSPRGLEVDENQRCLTLGRGEDRKQSHGEPRTIRRRLEASWEVGTEWALWGTGDTRADLRKKSIRMQQIAVTP